MKRHQRVCVAVAYYTSAVDNMYRPIIQAMHLSKTRIAYTITHIVSKKSRIFRGYELYMLIPAEKSFMFTMRKDAKNIECTMQRQIGCAREPRRV